MCKEINLLHNIYIYMLSSFLLYNIVYGSGPGPKHRASASHPPRCSNELLFCLIYLITIFSVVDFPIPYTLIHCGERIKVNSL